MSIFKRHDQGDVAQTTAAPSAQASAPAAQPEQPTKVMPPFATPRGTAPAGVVPPPAAPVYSMRPPEAAARAERAVEIPVSTAEKPQAAADSQDRLEGSLRVALQRTKSEAAPAQGARRRSALPPAPLPPQVTRPHTLHTFDPRRAAQAGLLHMAWSWQQSGAPIRAIHAYLQLLHRYPDTPAADAAVADLVALSAKLAENGQFHIALSIYEHLEELLA